MRSLQSRPCGSRHDMERDSSQVRSDRASLSRPDNERTAVHKRGNSIDPEVKISQDSRVTSLCRGPGEYGFHWAACHSLQRRHVAAVYGTSHPSFVHHQESAMRSRFTKPPMVSAAKAARERAGLTLAQAARASRVSERYLARAERAMNFSFVLAQRLAEIYSCPIDVFVSG